jgi:hypothetical protein
MKVPYTATWNLSLEHQIGQWGLRISYKGARSTQLIYLRNINNPAPSTTPFGTDSQVYYYPLYNSVTWADNGGNDFYSALEAAVQKRYGKNFIFNAGYTWCKGLTDTQDSGAGGGNYAGQVIQNQFNRAVEKGNDGIDLPQRFFAYGLYTLPVGQGQRLLSNAHGAVQQILGGWRANFTIIAQSGWWFQPSFSSLDPSNTNPSGGGLPDRIGNGNLSSSQRSITNWFNVAAFKIPGCPDTIPVCTASQEADVGRFGNAGYNILSDPRLFNLDFGLMKDFRISERIRLGFTVTMANAFNHPNFSTPDANISDGPGVAGVISGQVAGATGETNDREIDFGLRLEF